MERRANMLGHPAHQLLIVFLLGLLAAALTCVTLQVNPASQSSHLGGILILLAGLRQRQREPEIMDQPNLDRDRHVEALRGLQRINRWSASARIYWPTLRRLALHATTPLRVLDVATGGGDIPIQLWHRARRAGVALDITACDLSATALGHARDSAARAGAEVQFIPCDVLKEALPTGFDVVISSLFLHHLDDAQAITFLRRAAELAGRALLINDLRRCLPGLLLAQAGSRLLTSSPVVRVDGPRSVRAAFTIPEVRELAQQAGLSNVQIARKWPFRFLLSWQGKAVEVAGGHSS